MRTHNSRLRQAMNERDKGFTLIELLVVVIIIGILAAVAIPVFLNQRKKAVDSGIKSDLKNAALTVETWITDNPQSPITPDTTTGAGGPVAAVAGGNILADFNASPGNTITLTAGASTGTYRLTGQNPNSSEAGNAAECYEYVSDAGGLNDAWVAC